MITQSIKRSLARSRQGFGALTLSCLCSLALAGCGMTGASGPSTTRVASSGGTIIAGNVISVVDLDARLIERLRQVDKAGQLSEVLGHAEAEPAAIGLGDVVEISIWEAPPAVLFGGSGLLSTTAATGPVTQGLNLPQQEVGGDGRITVPFAGNVLAVGRTTSEIAHEIAARLFGKAHDPQVMVRVVQNQARAVTIVGEVAATRRMALTPRGERLLDAIAAAGGVKQPVGKTTVQVARGAKIASMPLDAIIRSPQQNIPLQPGDVVTVLHQPNSFIALGATSAQAELPFEGGGITLAQALGRIGGLRDERADVRGVFVFRMENAQTLGVGPPNGLDGQIRKVPVIYRVDLRDPASFFLAQDFGIRDKDILYVSNAPLADLQKFVNIVSSTTYSIVNIGNALN